MNIITSDHLLFPLFFGGSNLFFGEAIQIPPGRSSRRVLTALSLLSGIASLCVASRGIFPFHTVGAMAGITLSLRAFSLLAIEGRFLDLRTLSLVPRLRITTREWINVRLQDLLISKNSTNHPSKSGQQHTEEKKQSRAVFAIIKCIRLLIVCCAGQLDVMIASYINKRLGLTVYDYAPGKQGAFSPFLALAAGRKEDAGRQTCMRAYESVRWIIVSWWMLEAAHCFFAVVFVAVLGWDQPDEWPPLFGSISEAYSLRRFWGVYWHRLNLGVSEAFLPPSRSLSKIVSTTAAVSPLRKLPSGIITSLIIPESWRRTVFGGDMKSAAKGETGSWRGDRGLKRCEGGGGDDEDGEMGSMSTLKEHPSEDENGDKPHEGIRKRVSRVGNHDDDTNNNTNNNTETATDKMQTQTQAQKKKKNPALRALQIFLFSAVYHSLANLVLRGHANLYHELRFFLANFLLCYLETLASKFFTHARKRVSFLFGKIGGFHDRGDDEKRVGGEGEDRKLGSGELEVVLSAGGSGGGSGDGSGSVKSGKGLSLSLLSSLSSVLLFALKRLAGYLWVYTVFFCIAPAWQWSQAWALFERLLEEARNVKG